MGNPVVHWELMSKDPEKVSAFYEKIFGWKIQHMPEMNYRMVETGGEGGINGGIFKPEREGPWPGNMTLYIAVDDLATYRKKVIAAGGKVHVEEQGAPRPLRAGHAGHGGDVGVRAVPARELERVSGPLDARLDGARRGRVRAHGRNEPLAAGSVERLHVRREDVLDPVAVTSAIAWPRRIKEPAWTNAPASASTGADSPVSID